MLAIVIPLVYVAIPQMSSGHVRRPAVCDNVYVALNGEVANELDVVLRGGATACGTVGGPEEVIACSLWNHRDERNPRNRSFTAYTEARDAGAGKSSCRVGLEPVGTNGVRFNQYVRPESTTSRTFSVVVE